MDRTTLKRRLDLVRHLDTSASPYIGVQLGSDGIDLYRASNVAAVRTAGFRMEQPSLVVAYGHLRDSLDVIVGDVVRLEVEGGRLRLLSADPQFPSGVYVHTLRNSTPWAKAHPVGRTRRTRSFDPALFKGINPRPFTFSSSPVLKDGKLMLPTDAGIIMRDMPGVSSYPYPREALLCALSHLTPERIELGEDGYWVATGTDWELLVSGHRTNDSLFATYDREVSPAASFEAARMLSALSAAARWCADSGRIQVDPAGGQVKTEDALGLGGSFSLGSSAASPAFFVTQRTARTLVAALEQDADPEVSFGSLSPDTFQFRRGAWKVWFRALR